MFNSGLINFLPHIGGFLILILTIFTAGHVVIYKRDSRAAVGWIGVILIVPVIGAILYVIFGINRIKRKAIRKRRNIEKFVKQTSAFLCTIEYLKDFLPEQKKNLVHLGKVSNQVTRYSLLRGNSIVPLLYGDNAYPKMLEAIDYSSKSISLATYIFNNDIVGDMFINALSDAVKRGVEVRVLIDDVGAHYTFPSVVKKLQQRGIKTKIFMPTLIPWGIPFINLRNHKKILVVDGMIGFTGSMNIQAANVLRNNPRNPIKDAHFEIKGPIVTQVQKIFSEDWFFASKEILSGEKWFPVLKEEGAIISRVINDGPDEDFIKQLKIILGALACAEESVRIVTPYFLPESELISAINGALMRGVKVDVVLPEKNNHRIVSWASMAQLWQILEWGCKVWLNPLPFDHSKLMVVDNAWSMIGSANWDPRSLRLNFELNVESYSQEFAQELDIIIDEKIKRSRLITIEEVNNRPLGIKLRDGFCRLFTPYI